KYQFWISDAVKGVGEEVMTQFVKFFYSGAPSEPVFPVLSDDELLTKVQEQTFKYFWDFAQPNSGMARERNTSGDLVTSGGSGFGIMALIVGMERGFITRAEGLDRMDRILDFLEAADRFHGAWSHWIDGNSGKVIPFSENDNGGDLVETSFLIQGLLTFRQYLNSAVPLESDLIDRINFLWNSVEWDWYTREGQDVLYWHWSPDKGWVMNHQIRGYNECLITYVLAASSPTHTIGSSVYANGWTQNGAIKNGNAYYGITLPLGSPYGGPLFFAHYSFLGLDPRNLDDGSSNYWTQNVNHTLINQAYCIDNPLSFVGYSEDCWGLTASDNQNGYSAHSPTNDLGVIAPTAALSSFPYTPEESMKALKFFYYSLGQRTWGDYGFYDAFNITEGWYSNAYLAIDQGPIIVMIENYRSGLLWDLFKSCPEVQAGLTKLGFTY
ncbi:MAG TPA: glucoamylase family protein, partial [Cyclobacteriaceae bacterium]|nr:glucoamylase family protein [Cyclobacteriaceae bacterium]